MNYKGTIETKAYWIIPILLAVSVTKINPRGKVYGIHVCMVFIFGFAWRTKE